jgi:thioredoxin 1
MGYLIGAVVGGLLGYGFYRLVGCRTGGCPLTSKPWTSILYGVLVGLFLVYSSLSGTGCSKNSDEAGSPYVGKFTSDNWEKNVLKSEKPVLVDFWAPWCGPCRFQGPIVDKLAEEKKDSIVVGKLNVDDNQKISGQYGIRSIPTLIVFKNGEVLAKFVGVTGEEALRAALEKAISK